MEGIISRTGEEWGVNIIKDWRGVWGVKTIKDCRGVCGVKTINDWREVWSVNCQGLK